MKVQSSRVGLAAIAASLFFMAAGASGTQPLAFAGAEGAGRFAAGGRDGEIVDVTHLADDGPGSLRAAVNRRGPRIIRFLVEGNIDLKSELVIRHGRITLDGSNAPGTGISLSGHGLVIRADDVIVRYLRIRPGTTRGSQGDAVWVAGGRRIILDHLSASWAADEVLSAAARYSEGGIYDLTVQWCIIAESLRAAGHTKGAHAYGSLIRGGRGSRFSFHHNLWAHHDARMPRPGNYESAAIDAEGAHIEFRSNVFYNWGDVAAGYNADTESRTTYSFIDNVYVSGPDSRGKAIFREANATASAWFANNMLDGIIPSDAWSLVMGVAHERLPREPPFPPVATDPPSRAYTRVLAESGASHRRDAVDQRVVASVVGRTGRIINTERDVTPRQP
jgi:hypothetical protein